MYRFADRPSKSSANTGKIDLLSEIGDDKVSYYVEEQDSSACHKPNHSACGPILHGSDAGPTFD